MNFLFKCHCLHLCPGLNADTITHFKDFSYGLAKMTNFTNLTIFRHRASLILQKFSPFVMLITTHRQSGAADFISFNVHVFL